MSSGQLHSPHKTALTLATSLGIPRATLLQTSQLLILGSPRDSFRFGNLLEGLKTQKSIIVMIMLLLYQKDTS